MRMQVNECCGNLWHAVGVLPKKGGLAASMLQLVGVRATTRCAEFLFSCVRCLWGADGRKAAY
jgi:hypothetical protein